MNRLKRYLLQLPVPGNWSELDQRQFVAIAAALHRYEGPELKARITWILLNVRWYTPRRAAAILFGLSALDRHQLCTLADPFLQPEGLLNTPLRTLRAGRHVLHCAHHDLLNELDAETWGLVDTAFLQFNKTKDPDLLRAMASGLYGPEGSTRLQRLKGAYSTLCERIEEDELMALHLQWAGHRIQLVKDAPWVFRSKNEKAASRKKRGWNDVLLSMSGGKFGDFNGTSAACVRVFLRELSHRIEAQVQAENRQQEQRRKR